VLLKTCVKKLSSAEDRKEIGVCPNRNCQHFQNSIRKIVWPNKDLALGSKLHAQTMQKSSANLTSYSVLTNICRKSWL